MKKSLVLLLALLVLPIGLAAAAKWPVAGSPDKSFSEDGIVSFEGRQAGLGIAETRSGRIVQVRYPGSVVRYLPNGRKDLSLGGDGSVRTVFGNRRISPDDVLVDRRGRIVILGDCRQCQDEVYSWSSVGRLLPNGRPDRTFARKGLSNLPEARNFQPGEIAFAPGGGIVAVGGRYTVRNRSSIVVRYRQNGQLDRSFADGGIRKFGPAISSVNTVAVDKSGRIVVGFGDKRKTDQNPSGTTRLGVARLLPDGRFDHSFSGDGVASFVVPHMGGGTVVDLTIDRRGRVVGVGNNSSLHAPFFRLTKTGRLDHSFAKIGIDEVAWTSAESVSVDPKGRILVLGQDAEPYGDPSGASIHRYRPNGKDDPDFRYRGTLYIARDHFVDSRGRIVASGSVYGGPAIARIRNP